jgi:hypothetical protein
VEILHVRDLWTSGQDAYFPLGWLRLLKSSLSPAIWRQPAGKTESSRDKHVHRWQGASREMEKTMRAMLELLDPVVPEFSRL